MRRYKVLLPLLVHTEDGAYGQGKEFEKEFSPEDEQANVDSGLLEIVPSTYKVIGGSEVDGNAPGEQFEAAMTMNREAQLAGHIERVEKPAPKKKKEKK